MSIVGHRPLTREDLAQQYETVGHDYEGSKLVGEHRRLVMKTKPGLLSTFALEAHRGDIDVGRSDAAIHRVESEIRDARDASLKFDIWITAQMIKSVLSRKMKKSSTTIQYRDDIHANDD